MMNKRISALIIVCCVMATLCASSAFAQVTVNVSGHVYDESNNAPISGADIHVQNTDTSEEYHFITGENGYYSSNLPFGDYSVSVTEDDYQEWSQYFSIADTSPQVHDIYLTPVNDYTPGGLDDDSDSYSDDDSSSTDDESEGIDMPFGDMDEDSIETIMIVLISLVVIFFICLVTITIALMVISVRLGKIRKELVALNEAQKPKVQAAPQYQQPPPPPPQ